MADPSGGVSTQDWMLEQLLDDGKPLIVADPPRDPDDDVAVEAFVDAEDIDDEDFASSNAGALDQDADADVDSRHTPVHDLDDIAPDSSTTSGPPDINAGAKRTLLWLVSGVGLVAVLIVLVFLVLGGGPAPTPVPQHQAAATPAVSPVPTSPELPAPPQDQAIPFDPKTDSCPGGPTSPLALTDPGSDSAWVCSRGPQESQLDGQILHVKFLCDRSRPDSTCSYMLNSLSVAPGWVPKSPGGKDEWLQHRCVSRMQFNFYTGDELAADPFFLDTNCVHGPVSATLPGKILASRVDVMILHTERPPAAPRDTAGTGNPNGDVVAAPPGLADTMLGSGDLADLPPVTDPSVAGAVSSGASDPVDATFAISQMQFFGHSPN